MPLMYEYGVYDLEGNLVFRGNSNQLLDKYDVSPDMIYHYVKGGAKMKRKYIVKRLGIYQQEKEEVKIAKKLSEKEKYFNYLIRHLKEHGNVYSRVNPEKYLDELEELGYKCKIEKYYAPRKEDFVIADRRKNKKPKLREYDTDYVLVRLNEIQDIQKRNE